MSENDFIFRRAQTRDLEQIKRIEADCGLSPWSVQDYKNEIDTSSIFIVCEHTGKIAGFILARLITNNICQYNDVQKNSEIVCKTFETKIGTETETVVEAEILNIGVAESFRRKNIGSQMLNAVIAEAEKHCRYSIILDVRVSNLSAIGFYKRHGFGIINRRKNLYANPSEDGYFMRLEKN